MQIFLSILFLLALPAIAFATLTIRRSKRCPECGSKEIDQRRHRGSFALPECHYDDCGNCGHQFNQQ